MKTIGGKSSQRTKKIQMTNAKSKSNTNEEIDEVRPKVP